MAIHSAKNSETDETFGDLRLTPIERDRLIDLLPLFLLYIATLPTKSGTSKLLRALLFNFRSGYSMFLRFIEKVLQKLCEILLWTKTETS